MYIGPPERKPLLDRGNTFFQQWRQNRNTGSVPLEIDDFGNAAGEVDQRVGEVAPVQNGVAAVKPEMAKREALRPRSKPLELMVRWWLLSRMCLIWQDIRADVEMIEMQDAMALAFKLYKTYMELLVQM